MPHISFTIGEQAFLIPVPMVRGVIERRNVRPLPGTHPFVDGVIVREGLVLPVYDLRRIPDLFPTPPPDRPPEAMILLYAWEDFLNGWVVDRADVLPGEPEEDPDPSPPGIGAEFIAARHTRDGRKYLTLRMDSLHNVLEVGAQTGERS